MNDAPSARWASGGCPTSKCNHLPACVVTVQRQELGAMPAALAHEQHQPVVRSGDEAMGATKPLRCVYDRGLHSNLRLEVTASA
jgi:hypothetical protein